jgi:hypothetical protein
VALTVLTVGVLLMLFIYIESYIYMLMSEATYIYA